MNQDFQPSTPDRSGERTPISSPYYCTPEEIEHYHMLREQYRKFAGKEPWEESTFATRDLLDPLNGITLDLRRPEHRLIVELMDLPIIQRLKDIYQVGGAYAVYKEAGHRRFDHAIGSGILAMRAMENLRRYAQGQAASQLDEFKLAVVAAAVLHDAGHIAPRSHMAEHLWFPLEKGAHERMTQRIILADRGLQFVMNGYHPDLFDLTLRILREDPELPPWTWKLISGGGWNVDRGDWTYRDSMHCGVNYGKWDMAPLLKKLRIAKDGELCIHASGLELIEGFFKRRADMYSCVYHHAVSRVVEAMYGALICRAKELQRQGSIAFADEMMCALLSADRSDQVATNHLLKATDSWWNYHMQEWMEHPDSVLRYLAQSLVLRCLYKHFPDNDYYRNMLMKMIEDEGLDAKYYLLEIPPVRSNHKQDLARGIRLLNPDGSSSSLENHSRLLQAMVETTEYAPTSLLAIPLEPFDKLKLT